MPGTIDARTLQAAQQVLLAHLGNQQITNKAAVVSSQTTNVFGHGPGGLFSSPALDRQLFSAMMLPMDGLQARLPVTPTNLVNPLYGIITGVTATTGNEPIGPCDDFPVAGLLKLCSQSRRMGRMGRATRPFEIDRMGLLNSRGEHTDFTMVGGPKGNDTLVPTMPGQAQLNQALNSERGKAIYELGVAWMRDFAQDIYTGNPANNTSGGGRKYYRGLDLLINTGYQDAETGILCPAADSIIVSYGNNDVSTSGIAAVTAITSIYRNLRDRAMRMGLAPAKIAMVGRYGLFYELTQVWPCAYATYRCNNVSNTFSASQVNFIDNAQQVQDRQDMRGDMYNRTGQYLLIDGEQVEFIIDDAIPETQTAGGTYTSDIRFVPLTVVGGTPALYMEYIDYDSPLGAMDAARIMAPDRYQSSDNGRFLWHSLLENHYCVQMEAKSEPTLVLRAPMLAARLTNVRYTPYMHEREWSPSSPSNYTNGGATEYNNYAPSFLPPTING